MISCVRDALNVTQSAMHVSLPDIPSQILRHFIAPFLTDVDLVHLQRSSPRLGPFVKVVWEDRLKSQLPRLLSRLKSHLPHPPMGLVYHAAKADRLPYAVERTSPMANRIRVLQPLADGSVVYVANATLQVWKPDGSIRVLLTEVEVSAVTVLPDHRLVVGCADGYLRLWNSQLDSTSMRQRYVKRFHGWTYLTISCLAVVSDDSLLVGFRGTEGRIHEFRVGEKFMTRSRNYKKSPSAVRSLTALSADLVASGHGNGSICLWDRRTGSVLRSIWPPQGQMVDFLVPLPGQYLAAARLAGSAITFWNWADRQDPGVTIVPPYEVSTTGMAVTLQGRLVTCHPSGRRRLWNLQAQTSLVLSEDLAVEKLQPMSDGRYCCAYQSNYVAILGPDISQIIPQVRKSMTRRKKTRVCLNQPNSSAAESANL